MRLKLPALQKAFPSEDIESFEIFFINGRMLVPKKVAAKEMNVGERHIARWVEDGFTPSEYSMPRLMLYDIMLLKKWHLENIDQSYSKRRQDVRTDIKSEEGEENEFEGVDLDKVPKKEAERRKEIEAVKKLMMQNRILDGESISIDDVDKNMATQAATHISHLTNSEKILPELLENKSASDIQEILNDHNQKTIEQLSKITNIEIDGEFEFYDIIQELIEKMDDDVSIDSLMDGIKIVS